MFFVFFPVFFCLLRRSTPRIQTSWESPRVRQGEGGKFDLVL